MTCKDLLTLSRRATLTAMAATAVAFSALAVPAKPGLMQKTMADGSRISVRLVGDETFHYYLDAENRIMLEDASGLLAYAGMTSDGTFAAAQALTASQAPKITDAGVEEALVVSRQTPGKRYNSYSMRTSDGRRNGPGLFPDADFPCTGDQKVLVVLVEYTDLAFVTPNPHDYFYRLLNEEGFSDNGGTGSSKDYFTENSMGQFTPEFDLYGPITLSHPMSYYGGNDWYGNDQHPEQMIIEACQQLDATVDFSEYDRNNDGYIDNVFVFYAGRGEASGGSADTVWPHSWNVSSATSTPYYFDGVRLDRYACSNEWEGYRPDGIGTFVHEFSHVMGLPDLYATSYTGAFTPGAWSAMDYGPYNNNGNTPPAYSAFERYALGWMEPTVLDRPADCRLYHILNSNAACIIPTTSVNEYFLLENRQLTGWDAYIPHHGMLVWHVDYKSDVWNSNKVNNTNSHQYVDIEEADGTQSDYSRDGDPFPGAKNITSITDDTNPSLRTWANKATNMPITDIAETQSGVISFKAAGGRPILDPVTGLTAGEIGPGQFTLTWDANPEAIGYALSVCTKEEKENGKISISYVEGYDNLRTGAATAYTVTGLQPLTQYYCTVAAVADDEGLGLYSEELPVMTAEPTFEYFAPVLLDAYVSGTTAELRWEAMDEADAYEVSVYQYELGEPWVAAERFDNGLRLGQGWLTDCTMTYSNTAYAGEAIPSIRMNAEGQYILSPVFTAPIYGLRFWMRGVSSQGASVVAEASVNGAWTELGTYEVSNAAGGTSVSIDEMPEGCERVRLIFQAGTKGAVAVDDVEVLWGGDQVKVYVPGYEAALLPECTSHTIDGLAPYSDYYHTLVALSDGRRSLTSAEGHFATGETGICQTLRTSGPAVSRRGDTVEIKGLETGTIEVYAADGKRVAKAFTTGEASIALQPGVYMVKNNGRTFKAVL